MVSSWGSNASIPISPLRRIRLRKRPNQSASGRKMSRISSLPILSAPSDRMATSVASRVTRFQVRRSTPSMLTAATELCICASGAVLLMRTGP